MPDSNYMHNLILEGIQKLEMAAKYTPNDSHMVPLMSQMEKPIQNFKLLAAPLNILQIP